MASFLNDFGGEAKKNLREDLREGFEQNTGVFGQALRERRMREERKKRTEKEVASIQEGIGKLRLTSNSLFNIERSFLQISRNVQLIAKAMDAQVTLQKESDKLTKQLTDISQTKQQTAKPEPKQQAAIEKIGDQKEEQSLLSKISDLVDNFERKRRTGRTPQKRTPQKRTPRGRANRLKRLSKVNLGRAAQVLGRVGTTAARFSPVASVAAYGYGAYKASEFLEKTSYGASMKQGAGQTAENAFRNKDTSYGTDLTPDQARAILEQPDSPAKQRDIKAFGGLEKIQAIADIQLKAEPKPETKPTLPVSSAGGGRGVVNPALVKPREERVQPTQVWVDSEGRPITTSTGETVQAAPAAQPVKPIPPPPPPPPVAVPVAKPSVAAAAPAIAPTTPANKPTGLVGSIVNSLKESGITSIQAISNILATIKAETGFKVRSEDTFYRSAEAIQKTFGVKRIPTLEFAQQFVGKSEELANEVYKKTDGNSAPGDGYKYRGRGWIQHTGKNQYAAIAKYTGVDVLNNPDLLNDPVVATKALAWFFLKYKNKKPEQLESISEVNRAVGFADTTGQKAAVRAKSAELITADISGGQDLEKLNVNVAAAKRGSSSTPNVTVIAVTNQQTIKKPAGMPARNEYPTPVAA
jgi:predicted chitinase